MNYFEEDRFSLDDNSEVPEVSVVIPAFNEARFIENCIESLLNTSYPLDRIEIILVDGMSTDDTVAIAQRKAKISGVDLSVVQNEQRIKTPGLNAGILKARGSVIVVADAHSEYSRDYIRKNVANLLSSGAANVGGKWRITPRNDSKKAIAIALALQHPFGTGGAKFKRDVSEVSSVDTVPFGCFMKETAIEMGLFNENLIRNQDIEFNLRLKRSGKKILLFPDVDIKYFSRSTFSELWKNNFENGRWVILGWKYAKLPFSLRHLVPFTFLIFLFSGALASLFLPTVSVALFSLIGLYVFSVILATVLIAKRESRFDLIPFAFFSFIVLHFSYGFGSLKGFMEVIACRPSGKS